MKTKLLDTNVILEHSLQTIIERFDKEEEDIDIVIPFKVIMELDNFKKGNDIKNFHARSSLRLLEELRRKAKSQGKSLTDTLKISDNCTIRVHVEDRDLNLDPEKVDNNIILISKSLLDNVEIVTLDLHERIVADCFDVESNGLDEDIEIKNMYTGIERITITDNQLQEFNANYHDRSFSTRRNLYPNQFVIMVDSAGNEHYGIYDSENKKIRGLKPVYEAWGIKPKKDQDGNTIIEQAMLMHLLLDTNIHFVSAVGPSGSGKTLLTLACALQQTLEDGTYNKIIVMRPLVDVGKDIGALPGDKLEKLEPWMMSTFDNLEFLLEHYTPEPLKDIMSPRDKVYSLIENGILELEVMQFIRGRSIPNQFIIVDDAQNLTPHQAATIITRAGEGSKVVFLGDISKQQIDDPRLNTYNNGLTYVVEKFKGADPIIGHITLEKVVRSRLASLGVDLL